MQKKICLKFIFFVFFLFFIGGVVVAFENINKFEDNMVVTFNELNNYSNISFLNYLTIDDKDVIIKTNSNQLSDVVCSNIDLNLFGFLKVKTVKVNVANTNLILCGNTVGIYLENNGLTIAGFGGIKAGDSLIYPFENSGIKVGDVITKINDISVYSSSDIDNILNQNGYSGQQLNIEYISDGNTLKCELEPVYDASSRTYRLGLWVRENASGIGTLTYITSNNRFGALGHGICENGQNKPMQVSSGTLNQCEVLGITKGKRGDAGEIKAMFLSGVEEEGFVDKNNNYGVFGTIKQNSIYKDGQQFEIGGRLTAKPGRAYIYCQLNDQTVKMYEIEIIKTNYQSKTNQKSMVVRVVDKELIEKTGGIIQGMSGSPIVQDGKIIGAITHVFVNDPTKGFGVYLDWMLEQ